MKETIWNAECSCRVAQIHSDQLLTFSGIQSKSHQRAHPKATGLEGPVINGMCDSCSQERSQHAFLSFSLHADGRILPSHASGWKKQREKRSIRMLPRDTRAAIKLGLDVSKQFETSEAARNFRDCLTSVWIIIVDCTLIASYFTTNQTVSRNQFAILPLP